MRAAGHRTVVLVIVICSQVYSSPTTSIEAPKELALTGEHIKRDDVESLAPLSLITTTARGGGRSHAKATEQTDTSLSRIKAVATKYDSLLKTRPIRTKSITSGIMFGVSDVLAQSLQTAATHTHNNVPLDWSRIQTSVLVGFIYYGPSAHYWYNLMFQLFPESTTVSTLIKTALGQVLFGPVFMCVFFGATLLQQGNLTFQNYWSKLSVDLPKAWIAGLGFWPMMSYIAYTFIPKDWIPLFSNVCTLLFNVFLSLVAYQKAA